MYRKKRVYTKRKSTSRKRTYPAKKRRKYTSRRRKKPRFIIAKAIMPRQKVVSFRYSEIFNLDPAVTSPYVSAATFNANSCNDPFNSGTGHQPHGWDQWAVFYKQAMVIGSKATMRLDKNGTIGNTPSQRFWLVLSEDGKAFDDYANSDDMWENPYPGGHRRSRLGYANQMESNQWDRNRTSVVKLGYSAKKFFEVGQLADNKDDLAFDIKTSGVGLPEPTKRAYYECVAVSAGAWGVVDPAAIPYRINITYSVLLFDRQDMQQS